MYWWRKIRISGSTRSKNLEKQSFWSTCRASLYHTFDNSVVRHILHFFSHMCAQTAEYFHDYWIWQSQHLKTHEIIHTDEKSFSRSKCEKKFSSSGNLSTHERFHTDEKPFNCSQCERKLSQSQHLKTHERIHTDEKPFSCLKCEKKFSQ